MEAGAGGALTYAVGGGATILLRLIPVDPAAAVELLDGAAAALVNAEFLEDALSSRWKVKAWRQELFIAGSESWGKKREEVQAAMR